jgi:hypothetical protein
VRRAKSPSGDELLVDDVHGDDRIGAEQAQKLDGRESDAATPDDQR